MGAIKGTTDGLCLGQVERFLKITGAVSKFRNRSNLDNNNLYFIDIKLKVAH